MVLSQACGILTKNTCRGCEAAHGLHRFRQKQSVRMRDAFFWCSGSDGLVALLVALLYL